MRLGSPVDAHEPVALVLPRADPHAVGAAAMLTDPCTGAQGRRLPTGPSPRPLAGARVPLYGRSRAQTPHGAVTAATRRGTRPPVRALKGADSPRGRHRGHSPGHASPPGARSTGGGWSLPASWPDPNSLRQLNPDHDETYRGGRAPLPTTM